MGVPGPLHLWRGTIAIFGNITPSHGTESQLRGFLPVRID